jgi:hypothetical protein
MAKKSGEDAFVDADMFDPINIANAEAAEQEAKKISPAKALEVLNRRRVAYTRVFNTPGKATQGDVDIVLFDLARFCRGFAPKFDLRDGIHAAKLQDIKEGRAEVFYRILDFSRLDGEALLLKYTDASLKQGDN